jgi:1-acyl-sn-glycerol-3-phosphate acyltransferase
VIRSIWVLIVGFFSTAFYASRVLLGLRREDAGCTCERLARLWGQRVLNAAGVDVTVEGLENLDPDSPQLVVSNHESWFDVFVLVAKFPGRFRFVAKEELGRIPIFGPAWKGCGHVSIDRSDRSSAIRSLEEAADRIRRDRLTIVMFPEGTRSETGQLQPFKKGAFVLALESRSTVVPVAIHGSRQIMPKGSFIVRPGRIDIRIGQPIDVTNLAMEDRDELRRIAWERVHRLKSGFASVGETSGPTSG